MTKFKVGDTVRVVHVFVTDTYSVGDIGKVVDANSLGVVLVEFENYLSEYAIEEQLELVSKFKVGDRVRVTKVDADDPYKVGDQGVVLTNPDVSGILDIQFIEGYLEYAYPYQLELVWRPVTKSRNWWETLEGIEWLSTQQDVEEQFLKSQEKKEEKTYRVGQRFVVSCEGVALECILAQVEAGMVCLINLESGNRLHDPVHVFDIYKITEDEMKMIAEDCSFQLL